MPQLIQESTVGATPYLRFTTFLILLCSGAATLAQPSTAPVETPAPTTLANGAVKEQAPIVDPAELMTGAIDLTRGITSFVKLSMTIHRPTWERTSTLVSWSRGREDALIRFTAPAKDAGNATLKQGEKMWTFTPRLNRTIRLPFSLMSQSWAGSDFSYTDLSRSDQILRDYTLSLTGSKFVDGHWQYTIEAVPLEDAPVVWGKEEIEMRDDFVLLRQTFFDQDMQPLKQMETLEIGELGGRVFGTRMRMVPLDKPDQYTELVYAEAEFDLPLEDRLFTLFSLKSGSSRR